MANAFQCDDCGEFHEGGVHNGIEVSGLGITTIRYAELCHECAVERLGDLIDFEGVDEDGAA